MTNSIEKADRAMKRRDIFERLAKKADERMTPVLSEAIDEIASRDAEVAELNHKLNEPVLLSEWQQLEKERDQLRDQVSALQRSIDFDQIQAQQETIYQLRKDVKMLREAVRFYADGHHFILYDDTAWDTVSCEPQNFQEDDANTAMVEDGEVARQALAATDDHHE